MLVKALYQIYGVFIIIQALLTICPPSILSPRFESGIVNLHAARGLSEANQVYSVDQDTIPFYEQANKLESLVSYPDLFMITLRVVIFKMKNPPN